MHSSAYRSLVESSRAPKRPDRRHRHSRRLQNFLSILSFLSITIFTRPNRSRPRRRSTNRRSSILPHPTPLCIKFHTRLIYLSLHCPQLIKRRLKSTHSQRVEQRLQMRSIMRGKLHIQTCSAQHCIARIEHAREACMRVSTFSKEGGRRGGGARLLFSL